MIATAVDSGIGGCLVFRHSWTMASAGLALAATLALGCARPIDLVNSDAPDSELAALVDSDAARRLLADVLARRSADARLPAASERPRLTDLASSEPQTGGAGESAQLPDQAFLKKLANRTSMDFSALVFARALAAEPRSRAVQAAFDRFLQEGAERSADALRGPGAFPYTLLFAPSWLYKSHPENGSDFANQRRILDTLGVRNRLIESGESDSVEDNAAVIARTIRETGCEGGPLFLVSASKSGAEAAAALSSLTPEEGACVAAWINIAGALRGTPLADSALRVPVKWLARGIFFLSGWSWDALESLETERSRRRLETLRLPETVTVLNIVAVPVSGSVGYQVYPGYQVLGSHGPNDGVVLLADTVWPGGINIVGLGADHLFGRWREDAYILAMLRALDLAIRSHNPRPEPTVTAADAPATESR
ncbi:MAG: hypothetical protein DMD87_13670 [Candidatus Rokuibacteriota bacterium]|nr:MAG: hypothetical protein DMD87_13670 [Candidatus Rokubacteria bacterium]